MREGRQCRNAALNDCGLQDGHEGICVPRDTLVAVTDSRERSAVKLSNDHDCVICGRNMPESACVPSPGWAIRADNAMATCPEHSHMTPPAELRR